MVGGGVGGVVGEGGGVVGGGVGGVENNRHHVNRDILTGSSSVASTGNPAVRETGIVLPEVVVPGRSNGSMKRTFRYWIERLLLIRRARLRRF